MSDEKTAESVRGSTRGLLSRAAAFTQKSGQDVCVLPPEPVSAAATPAEEQPVHEVKPAELFARFHEFSRKAGIDRAGVFIQRQNTYALVLSHNLDRDTVRHPETPEGFWTTMYFSRYDRNGWTALTGDALRPFLPLFSQTEQERTASLALKTFDCSDTRLIFCVLSPAEEDFTAAQQQEIEANFPALARLAAASPLAGAAAFLPPFEGKITAAAARGYEESRFLLDFTRLFENLGAAVTDADRDVLFFSLYAALSALTGSHNICKFEDENTFSLAVFTAGTVRVDGYRALLEESLSRFFDDGQLAQLAISMPQAAREL